MVVSVALKDGAVLQKRGTTRYEAFLSARLAAFFPLRSKLSIRTRPEIIPSYLRYFLGLEGV